jgi:hypothetical protein
MDELLTDKITKEVWVANCANAGISESPLAPADMLTPASPT